MLSDLELSELKERSAYAASHGFQIALAKHYVEELEDEAGAVELPLGTESNSAAHILALAGAVEEARTKPPQPTQTPVTVIKSEKSAKKADKKAAPVEAAPVEVPKVEEKAVEPEASFADVKIDEKDA
jgi:cell division septation protein DedD